MENREIEWTDKFRSELKKLERKHRGLENKVIDTLRSLANETMPPGDKMPGVSGHPVFKARIKLGNMGQRRGARIIYYKDDKNLWALSLYSKNQKGDITDKDIKNIMETLKEFVL